MGYVGESCVQEGDGVGARLQWTKEVRKWGEGEQTGFQRRLAVKDGEQYKDSLKTPGSKNYQRCVLKDEKSPEGDFDETRKGDN